MCLRLRVFRRLLHVPSVKTFSERRSDAISDRIHKVSIPKGMVLPDDLTKLRLAQHRG